MAKPIPQYLFLCGVGRSGTTILRTSLGLHDEIYYNGHENNLIQDIVGVALNNCTMRSRKVSMVVEQSEYDDAFRALICRLVWPSGEYGSRPVHMAAINPTPEQLDFMRQLFPQSKFIGLIRNGIEVVSSRTEYKSFSANEFDSHCEVWNRSADVHAWGKQNDDCFFSVRHEWFYQPEVLHEKMEQLYRWLSIEHSDAPIANILGTLRHPTSSEHKMATEQFHASAIEDRQKYFLAKRERWHQWTEEQKEVFGDRCGQNMTSHGYEIPWS